jgi:hypothetical protein
VVLLLEAGGLRGALGDLAADLLEVFDEDVDVGVRSA